MLESLYPLHRHSPNRCMICNYTFPHHLEHWWRSNLYSPYDMHLEEVKHMFDHKNVETDSPTKARHHGSKVDKSKIKNELGSLSTYRAVEFHKRYVSHQNDMQYSNLWNRVTRENSSAKYKTSHTLLGTTYSVPMQDIHKKTSTEILCTLLVRSILLLKIDSLIMLQHVENKESVNG